MSFRTKFIELHYILSHFSLSKIFNVWAIYFSYYKSKRTSHTLIHGLPLSISIEPTTSCNLTCPQCPSGLRSFTRPVGMLNKELFAKVINQLQNTLLYLTFYFQGEPFLNKKFFEMIRYASDRNIFTMTSTNGHFLTPENCQRTIESGLNKLIISLDGASEGTYQKYRIGGSYHKVIEGIKELTQQKKRNKSLFPLIIVQFIVFKHNEHELAQIKSLAKELEIDELTIKTAQIYDYENSDNIIPTNESLSRYHKSSSGHYTIKNKLLNSCWRMWHSCVITWDGSVVPCCFDKDASHKLGNVNQMPFKDVWNNSSYLNFRSALLKSRKEIDICKNCTEGTKAYV